MGRVGNSDADPYAVLGRPPRLGSRFSGVPTAHRRSVGLWFMQATGAPSAVRTIAHPTRGRSGRLPPVPCILST